MPTARPADEEGPTEQSDEEVTCALTDVSDAFLEDLSTLDKPSLADALQEIREEVSRPDEAVAGFNSSL
jgi:FXSXX-COOH protein